MVLATSSFSVSSRMLPSETAVGEAGTGLTAHTAPVALATSNEQAFADVVDFAVSRRALLNSRATAERGRKALALVKYPWQERLPGWTINFLPSRPGFYAMTFNRDHRIEIYVRPDRTTEGLAHDIAHELGHAVDVTYNSDEDRAEFLRLRGLPAKTAWWVCDRCTDLSVGAGDFAETFALWAAPPYRFYSELGSVPSEQDLAFLQHLFNRARIGTLTGL